MRKATLFTLIFLSFVTTSVFGTLLLSQHHHEIGCPFMPGENTVCDMGVFDHLSAWEALFTVTIPALFVLAFVATVVSIVIFFNSSDPPLTHWARVSRFDTHHRLRELLLLDILNPRAP